MLKRYTYEMLQKAWEDCFEQRVKSGPNKGCITIKATKFGDKILDEANQRGVKLETPSKYR